MDIVEREALVQRHMTSYYGVDHLVVANLLRSALTELASGYERKQALLLEAHCERVSSLQERIRQLEAEQVPDGFLSDVITAAGLLAYGKRDKGLAERLSIGAFAMLAATPQQPKKEGE